MEFYTTISILSSDFSEVKKTLREAEEAGAAMIHWDVMDGCFVPNLTFGAKFIDDCRKHTGLIFDTHLMITSPQTKVASFLNSSDIVTFHYEAIPAGAENLIKEIHLAGKKVGISINPSTDPVVLHPYLTKLDFVLLMAVEPGRGGQKLNENVYERLKILTEMRRQANALFSITVDGGVDGNNATALRQNGADGVVLGTSFVNAHDKKKLIETVSVI